MESPPLPQRSAREPRERARLKVQWETLPAIMHEMRYLGARHQAEAGDYEPFSPDWETYYAYARSGSAAAWTARTIDSNVLVGYIIWISTRGLHCVETIFATADLVYLAPEWREGMTGYKLLKSGIAAVKVRGADLIKVETNDLYEGGRMGVLLKRLGFRRIGSVWQANGKQRSDGG